MNKIKEIIVRPDAEGNHTIELENGGKIILNDIAYNCLIIGKDETAEGRHTNLFFTY